ncbi:uncharacterized protein KNAG_0B00840 [Huiozyma naganishii CBS 8797]|uniref:Transport and Golgi organization protein 2 n=1 Tax=Huiozyma naganishii (strain ATCC MYA-139 / BCRC 22969 / CBS 8797 / KCTC 17520 / NBRC 10181 / NCYC 3082 / Yp74L-3) TaxID=1071383 RepID=J7S4F4_HUIN7|nr:hypothetical protein KNAG_0B00840 [Kazachstania naganishii CBS 8797]CCK68531.1 hypothetical protein KNAG_0B00840 [Kazachstania naganishii CBS 8797]
MCILLGTREHPDYDLVLISNRDEFFERDTHITEWHSGDYILSPYDMTKGLYDPGKCVRGTWMGLNRAGRVSTVLNLKLEGEALRKHSKNPVKRRSRGLIPFMFLSDRGFIDQWDSFEKFRDRYPDLEKSGDFNLFIGDIRQQDYKVLDSSGNTFSVLNETTGMNMVVSNDTYKEFNENDISEWNKVKLGKLKLHELVNTAVNLDKSSFIDKCFHAASFCSIEKSHEDISKTPEVISNTIFVPPLKCQPQQDVGLTKSGGLYFGTRSQLVTLVSKDRRQVTVAERILHTSDLDRDFNSPHNPKEVKQFTFDLSD